MKGTPIDQLVYEAMYPKPTPSHPQNFHSVLHRHLILEVRQEVHAFYGHLDTQEAKYPGLDYTNRTHRTRLSRWAYHRRLFRAFDTLRLTDWEISQLTKWEGTKWAKERYERDSDITIRDTAFDDVGVWIEPEDRPQVSITEEAETPVVDDQDLDNDDDMEAEDESEGELESIGFALNERLRERAARREAGEDTSEPLDEEWELWLKAAIDSGALPFLTEQILRNPTESTGLTPQSIFPPQMLGSARAGRWEEVPEFLHDVLRRTIETEQAPTPDTTSQSPESSAEFLSTRAQDTLEVSAHNPFRNFSTLRLPAAEVRSGTNPGTITFHRAPRPAARSRA